MPKPTTKITADARAMAGIIARSPPPGEAEIHSARDRALAHSELVEKQHSAGYA
jgi:hypothetical protein